MNAIKKNLTIHAILQDQNSPITELYKKGCSLSKIDKTLKKILDPSLREHFQIANINDDIAVLLASSSAWATRLRYNIPAILDALNNQLHFDSIKTIRIKVSKTVSDHSDSNKRQIGLSNKSAQFLRDTANNFNDPEISACIQKLSKHHL